MSAARPASDCTKTARPAGLDNQLDRRSAALARILAHVADHHVGALGSEAQGHGASEAGRAAGHDDRFPLEASHRADRRRAARAGSAVGAVPVSRRGQPTAR